MGTTAQTRPTNKKRAKKTATAGAVAVPVVKRLTISVVDFDSVVEQLKECTHLIVAAAAEDETDHFAAALVRLHEARGVLESCVEVTP